jgi:hypothetical protein
LRYLLSYPAKRGRNGLTFCLASRCPFACNKNARQLNAAKEIATMKAGVRLKSAVCDTEVIVIRCDAEAVECGGAPMAETRPAAAGDLDTAHAHGTQMGKRYIDAAGTCELLCVKAGKGSLALDGEALSMKDAKPLPASD